MRQGMKASFLFLMWDGLNLPTSHPISAPYVRFYEPQGGGIYLDGCPASAFSLGEWSRAVAMVGQEPVLFSGTIGEPGGNEGGEERRVVRFCPYVLVFD